MKKIIIVLVAILLFFSPAIVYAADTIIVPPLDPNLYPEGSFCRGKNGVSVFINGKEYGSFSVRSAPGMARDYKRNVRTDIDSSEVTWRSMIGYPELVVWEKDENIIRLLYKSQNNKETDIYWWPAGEDLGQAWYFTLSPPMFRDEAIFNWVLRTQKMLDNVPLTANKACPGQTIGAKRGANDNAINSCKDKWLDAPLMSTDEGKKLLEEEYKKFNDFHSLDFKPGEGGIIDSDEDKAMYETFFLYADLTDKKFDTYSKATYYGEQYRTKVLLTLENLGVAREKVEACGKNLPSSIITYITMDINIPDAVYTCYKAATVGAIQGGAEKIIKALSDPEIKSAMAKQLHALTYLRKYIEYRQCLAQNDPGIKETVDKEVENYNDLKKLADQDFADADEANRGAGWDKQVLNKVVCWLRDGFIGVFFFEAKLAAWFLRRNY